MNYQEYIKSELLVLIPVLYLIGIGLKKSRFKDRNIPVALGAIAVILSSTWVLSTSEIGNYREFAAAVFTALTQGVLLAGASVYVNQLYIQANKEEFYDDSLQHCFEEIIDYPQQDTYNCDNMVINDNKEEENNDTFCYENQQTGSGK